MIQKLVENIRLYAFQAFGDALKTWSDPQLQISDPIKTQDVTDTKCVPFDQAHGVIDAELKTLIGSQEAAYLAH